MNLSDALSRLESLLQEASEVPKGPSQQVAARVKALSVIIITSYLGVLLFLFHAGKELLQEED